MSASRAQVVAEIPRLRRYARALAGDQSQADDLVQDCLERALGRLHLWRARGTVRAWLFTIMHNIYANRIRSEQTGRRVLARNAAGEDPPRADGAERDVRLRDLDRALTRLSDEHREIVLLIGLEQLSYREAAAVLRVPEGTVMSRLARARARLRTLLETEGRPAVRRVK